MVETGGCSHLVYYAGTQWPLWAPTGLSHQTLCPSWPPSPNPVLFVLTLSRLDVDLNNIYSEPL